MTSSMSTIEQAMTMLIKAFYQYSGKEGSKETLTKKELSDMLRAELHIDTQQANVDEIFKGLDNDKSGTVDFQEFVTLVACITAMTNEMLMKHS
ncbi:ictacalcin-like [Polymixia lowei]